MRWSWRSRCSRLPRSARPGKSLQPIRQPTAAGARPSRGRSSPSTCRSSRPDRWSRSTASTPARTPSGSGIRRRAVHAGPYGRNLFCSGHVQLADGRTLFVGGHINANDGLADTTIFNPVTKNTWFRGPDMSVGRWYPTATQLPDGRVLAFAGDNIVQDRPGAAPPFSDASVNSLPSVYDPKTNTWTDLTAAQADLTALSVHVRAVEREASSTPARTRRRGSSTRPRGRGRRSGRARSTATAPSCTGRTRS